MDTDEKKAKATDLLVESLRAILTIATVLLAGLLAFGVSVTDGNRLSWYVSLAALVFVSLLSLVNVNSLINKVYRGDLDAIMKRDVKVINVLVLLSLAVAIGAGAYFVMSTRSEPKGNGPTTVTDDRVVILPAENARTTVEKRDGKVNRVIIESK